MLLKGDDPGLLEVPGKFGNRCRSELFSWRCPLESTRIVNGIQKVRFEGGNES